MNRNSDNEDSLPPIPTPFSRRWREFRIRFVPFLMFGAALFAAVHIWQNNVYVPVFQGEVEPVRANVASPQTGLITHLKVTRFQKVSQGDPIATIVPTDPRIPLALIQSELDMLRARVGPEFSGQRYDMNYERIRLDWLSEKVKLAEDRVSLARAINELARNEQLYQQKLISEDLYDSYLKRKELLQVEVDEKAKVIADLEMSLDKLKDSSLGQISSSTNSFLRIIQEQEKKLQAAESQLGPVTLYSPFDGMVSFIFRHEGENVQGGDPILTIAADHSDRIVGYLKQPFFVKPQIGMAVEVRSRSSRGLVHEAKILQVGSQLEPVTNSVPSASKMIEMMLPVEISMPKGLKAYPGEFVDLAIVSPR